MKRFFYVICMVAAFSVCADETSLKLRSFTSNMPQNLVQHYEDSTDLYADRAETPWYEILFYRRKKGFVSQVDDGYHAELFSGYGPLLAFYMKDEESEFDDDGVIESHQYESGILWGALYSSNTFIDKSSRYQRVASGWKIFGGLLGYKTDLYGKSKLRLFWFPIRFK